MNTIALRRAWLKRRTFIKELIAAVGLVVFIIAVSRINEIAYAIMGMN